MTVFRGIFADKLSRDIATIQVNLPLHPPGIAKSSTSFSWGKGGEVTAAGCDPILHVVSRSGDVISITNCYIRFALLHYWTFEQLHNITVVYVVFD